MGVTNYLLTGMILQAVASSTSQEHCTGCGQCIEFRNGGLEVLETGRNSMDSSGSCEGWDRYYSTVDGSIRLTTWDV